MSSKIKHIVWFEYILESFVLPGSLTHLNSTGNESANKCEGITQITRCNWWLATVKSCFLKEQQIGLGTYRDM